MTSMQRVITGPKLLVSNETNIYRIPVQIETVGRMHFDMAIKQPRGNRYS